MGAYKEFEFITTVKNTDYIVRDHRVHQVRIMPGVTFLDMIYRALKTEGFDLSGLELRTILFQEPVVTTEEYDRKIEIALKKGAEFGTITARSQKVKDNRVLNQAWETNFQCELHLDKKIKPGTIDIEQKKRDAVRVADMDECYAYTRKLDIHHYEFMKALGSIYQGEDYLLAELRPGDLARGYLRYSFLHPAYLDASTILLTLFLFKHADPSLVVGSALKPSVPIYIESFRALDRLNETCFVHIQERDVTVSSSQDISYSSIDIYNENGALAASFKKLGSKKIRAKELIKNLEHIDRQSREPATHTPKAVQGKQDDAPDAGPAENKNTNGALKKSIEQDLRTMIARMQNKDAREISLDAGFYDQGLDSGNLLLLVQDLERKLGQQLYPTLLFEYSNIKDLAGYLVKEYGGSYEEYIGHPGPEERQTAGTPGQRLYYREVWEKSDIDLNAGQLPANILLFDTDEALSNAIKERSETNGAGASRIILVRPGKSYRALEGQTFEIDPASREDYHQLAEALKQHNMMPDTIIHLWSKEGFTSAEGALDTQLLHGVYSLFYLTQALMAGNPKKKILFLYLYFTRPGELQPQYAAVNGFARTAHRENPRFIYKTIAMDDPAAPQILGVVSREFQPEENGEGEIRYDGEERFVKRLRRIELGREPGGDIPLRENGVYVITGGFGGLGSIFADYLAGRVRAKLVLVGRSDLTARDKEKIEAWKSLGSDVLYIKADVSRREDVDRVIADAKSKFKDLNGVIHAAGVIRDSFVIKKTWEEMDAVLAPKVYGTVFLDEALREEPLDFFVMFSSTAAVVGNVGQGDYAYGNSFMDNYAEARERLRAVQKRKGRTLSINWPLWREGGMKINGQSEMLMKEKAGIVPLSTESGLKAFEELFTLPDSHVLVIEGEEEKIKSALGLDHPGDSFESRRRITQEPDESKGQTRITERALTAENHETVRDEDIAIIGVSGRYPMAKTMEEFWENLKKSKDCVTEIPAERWDYREQYDPDKNKKGKSYGKWGGFVDDVDKFDPLFFNISPREAESMDPQARLFLETVWHTLEDAGCTRSGLGRETVGVFVGVMWGQYQLFGAEETQKGNVMALESSYASIANRVSSYFNFCGPSVALDTMCSSSLTAIHLACDSIHKGEIDLAIAGGVNLTVHPNKYIFLSQGKLLSSDGKCRCFGEGGDGYVPGEGVGAVLLKPVHKALSDGDRIYAVIKGSSMNHGGKTGGYSVPNPNAQAGLILDTLKKSKIDPGTISYIEASSTGTSLGDQIEIAGLTKAFREYTAGKQFCSIGSAKSNIGHLESAAGIAGLTKILLQMKHRQLAPSLHSQNLNSGINFKDSPFYVQQETEEWKQPVVRENGEEKKYPRRAAISSFGAGGANVHIIVEEFENGAVSPDAGHGPQIILLSAKDEERLRAYAGKMIDFLDKEQGLSLLEIAYTLQVGREAMDERLAVVVSRTRELRDRLSNYIQGLIDTENVYRGTVKSDKAKSELLVEGKEGKDFLNVLIRTGKFNKLAHLWASGIDIDWRLLYPAGTPRRISLPLYSFASERYWVPGSGNNTIVSTGARGKMPQLHPLIDSNESTFEEQSFKKIFTGEEFFIKDHGSVVPAVAYIEMARAAGELANQHSRVRSFKNLVWSNPIIVKDSPQELCIRLFPNGSSVEFDVSTAGGGKAASAQGKLFYENHSETGPETRVVDIEAVLGRCRGGRENAESYYEHLQSFGPYVGPRFRGVREFYYNEQEALSRLGMPAELEQGFHEFVLHPTLTDGGIQTVVAWVYRMAAEPGAFYLPFVLGELELVDPSLRISYAYAERATGGTVSDVQAIKYNVLLLDEQGCIAVSMKELSIRPVRETVFLPFKGRIEVGMGFSESSDQTIPTPARPIPSPALPLKGREEVLQSFRRDLSKTICEILKVPGNKISPDDPLSKFGFDSVAFTELANVINETYTLDITPAVFFGNSSPGSIASNLFEEHGEWISRYYQDGTPSALPETRNTEKETVTTGELKTRFKSIERQPQPSATEMSADPVAIIGMSGIMPQSDDLEAFWRNLEECKDLITEIPRDRWDWKAYYGDPRTEENKTNVKWGGFMKEVDKFDPLFFSISPREAELMDPQERIILETVWKTVEDAGYKASELSGTNTGVFLGVCNADYKELLIEAHKAVAISQTMLANRISYLLNLHGPSEPVDTACSSSLVALHRAVEAIQSGNCELAFAGGINVIACPNLYIQGSKAGMLSEDGRCKTFDKRANGYVRGEGAGVLLLKPLSKAVADGDHIYAVIKGTGINHGGHGSALTVPNPDGQAELLMRVYEKAGIDPGTVSYIEAHGTGTSLGDPVEIEGLKRAFKYLYKKWDKTIPEQAYCGIGTVKTNIGHLESAAGIAGIFKILLSMQHKKIPGNVHFEELNPYIQLQGSPFYVVEKTREWDRLRDNDGREMPRRAGVSSFGIGGVNAHIVIEEFIPKDQEGSNIPVTAQNPAIIVLSAKNEERLKEQAQQLLAAIQGRQSDVNLADMAYTLQIGREAMEERLAMIVGSVKDLEDKLKGFVKGRDGGEALYRGQVKRNKETLAVFAADEDLQKAMDSWVVKRKYEKLLDLWVKGLIVDWNKLYGDTMPCRISLPTYPFARERYWAPEVRGQRKGLETIENGETMVRVSSQTSPQSAPISKTPEGFELMTFEEVWQEQALLDTAPVRIKTLVCFLSNPANQQVFIEAMQTLDSQTKVIFISEGDAYQKQSSQKYTLTGTDRNAYAEVLKNIREDYGGVDAIIYLWALEDPRYIQEPYSIVYILQAIASTKLKTKRFLLAGQFETALERCYLESWIGFERSLGLALPNTHVAAILGEQSREVAMKDWILRLWSELQTPKAQSVLYQEGKRQVCRIQPTTIQPSDSILKSEGTYLITGGCGGLGFLVAEHLVKKHPVNLILIGRSPIDTEKQSKIRALEDSGSRVLYVQADVCDVRLMKEGLSRAKERFGRINGIIHAAGIEGNQGILEKEIQSFQKVLYPKIQGTLVLDESLQEEALDFICYFSSFSAILGDFGSCDYAVGNRFQMAYARYRNYQQRQGRLQGKAIVINWPLWKDGGMRLGNDEIAEMYLKSSGQRFLEAEEGVAMFDRLLAQNNTQHLVVVGQRSRVHRFLGLVQDQSTVSTPIISISSGASKGRRVEMKGLSVKQCLEWDLKELAGKVLKISRDKLDREENLAAFGFDSMSLAEFATLLTNHYRIEITPAVFFGHSTIEKLIQYFLQKHQGVIEEFYQGDAAQQTISQRVPVAGAMPERKEPGKSGFAVQDTPQSIPEPIAIIGMSGRFPEARNIEEMWNILAEGQDAVKEVPADRFPGKAPGKLKWKCGCVPGVGEFDPLFFEISPREAESMDPRQRLLLQESWKALEDAGYGASRIKTSKIGMFVGVEEGDYRMLVKDKGNITSNHTAILAARLSYFLNLNGPNMAINTACSSGLVAAHQACWSLRNRECDTAIAAGVNLIFTGEAFAAMNRAGMLSEDGTCYAFDKRANGMVPGEAVAVVVLKRLSQAKADGDPISAIIQGSGVNYDGKTNGITAPSGVSQTDLLKAVYDQHKVNPEELEYIVTHGTGTKLGDPVEINALYDAFKDYTKKQGYCALTSTKTNFGHTFAASGLVSLISLVQAFRHKTIPGSLHGEQENDYITWHESPFYVNKTSKPWPERNEKGRTGAVSAFGMSGTNAHMVLRSYSCEDVGKSLEQPPYFLLALSAITHEALQEKIKDMIQVLQNKDLQEQDLSQVSYTLLEGRRHFNHRCAIVVQDREDALYVLQYAGGREKLPNLFQGKAPRNFTGQKAMEQFAQDLLKQSISLQENKNKYQEILYALADLYCQGYEFDWNKLYGDAVPRRISLPTYPFARERYWAPEAGEEAAVGGWRTEEKGERIHPLLHRNTSNLSEQRFSSTFTGQEFFLADHVVKGQRVLPGVAYIEMARAAVEQATGAREKGQTGIRLKNIVWASPISLNGRPIQVHIGLYPEDSGEIAYEIYSCSEENGAEPVVHSQGVAAHISVPAVPTHDIKAILAQCNQGSLSAGQCYEAFKAIGIEYGPGHRGIEKVYVGSGQVVAKLSLPSSVSDTGDQFILHPSLMDSALQASIGFMMGSGDPTLSDSMAPLKPALPFALQELEVLNKGTSTMWALVRYSNGGKAGDTVRKYDIDVCDEQGNICVRMKRFSSRVLEGEVGSRESSTALGTLMLEPRWEEHVIAREAPSPEYAKHIVLLCEPGEVSRERIEDRINGVRYLTLRSEQSGIDERFQNYAVRVFEEIQSILKEKPKVNVLIQVVVFAEHEQQLFSGLSGLLKTARLENPKLIGQLIEMEPGEDSEGTMEKLKDNSRCAHDSHIRYQDGKRWVLNWGEVQVSKEKASIPWKDQGIYLITGGVGGLGLIFAKEIAHTVKDVTLILMGISSLNEAKQAQLKELEASGARIEYRQADVTQKKAVADLIRSIQENFGNINGIIHAAGVIRDNLIIRKTKEEFQEVLAPKVNGLVNLDQAGKDLPLDFFIFFSSLAGAMGNPGQADYSAANAFMDAYARYRNTLVASSQRQGRTLSIDWPFWKEGGMRVNAETEKMMLMQTMGMIAMQTSTGVQALYQSMASDKDQVIVVEGNLGRMNQKLLSMKTSAAPKSEKIPAVSFSTTGIDTGSLLDKVQAALIQAVSKLLKVKIEDIDADTELNEYGFDSITLTEYGNILNREYKLELTPTIFFEHSTLRSFAQYLVEEHQTVFASKFGLQTRVDAPVQVMEDEAKENKSNKRRHSRFARTETLFPSKPDSNVDESIAIVGMSGRFPMAGDLNQFWRNLVEGKDCIAEIPKERWDWREYYGDTVKEANKTNIKWGSFIDGVDEFDPLFFGISPREAELMDPQQRLLMTYIWKAIEDAGYSAQSLSETRTALFVGTASSGYGGLISRANIPIEGYNATGLAPSMGPNRMSYFLNIHGPSEPIETACSSSLVAIHRAVNAIENGTCEMAIVGGINTILTPEIHISLSKAGMLCEDGRCKTFSNQANGYVRGEGVGMLFLKKLTAAEQAGDHIYGVIRGTAENHGGRANSLTAPNPKAQADLLITAYRKAGIDPRTISYIEAHGTGTDLGDPIEINGLKAAFKELYQETGGTKVSGAHCGLGSVKTNIGHLELAAGVAGLIKVLLQLKHRTLAKSLHCETVNPYIQLNDSPFYIVKETIEWKALHDAKGGELPRRAGVSSFGFGGVNVHVVIEEYIPKNLERARVTISPQDPAIILLSAKNEKRLKEQARQFLTLIAEKQFTDSNLADMAYTLQVGREAMEERLAFIAGSMKEVEDKLNGFVEGRDDVGALYRGQVKRNKETLAVFAADEDLQNAMNSWFVKRKYEKLLDLWVKGLIVDWNKLYGDATPRRISLPTYPFARERYWVREAAAESIVRPAAVSSAAVIRDQSHQNRSNVPEQRVTLSHPEPIAAAGLNFSDAIEKPRGISLRSLSHDQIPASKPSDQAHRPVTLPSTDISMPQPVINDESKSVTCLRDAIPVEKLMEDLANSLAEALYMKRGDVDADKQFVDTGLDSITGVEWIRVINKQYGTSIPATKVYDYPTIREFAGFLEKELSQQASKIIQAPLNSSSSLSLDKVLQQVYQGTLGIEKAGQLLHQYEERTEA